MKIRQRIVSWGILSPALAAPAILAPALAITTAMPGETREPCNRQRYVEEATADRGRQYVCRHDLENNDDEVNEFYTYKAWNRDGLKFQHQDQFRKGALMVKHYHGMRRQDGYWQWQQTSRFDNGDYSGDGVIKRREYAQRHPNGAWQRELEWRDSVDGARQYCYVQSAVGPDGGRREALGFCEVDGKRMKNPRLVAELRNPGFRKHRDW